jgi:hypothetical protein
VLSGLCEIGAPAIVAVGVVGAVAAVLIHNSQRVAALPSTSIVFSKAEDRLIRDIARRFCVDRVALGEAIHGEKKGGPRGKEGDLGKKGIEEVARGLPKLPGCTPSSH